MPTGYEPKSTGTSHAYGSASVARKAGQAVALGLGKLLEVQVVEYPCENKVKLGEHFRLYISSLKICLFENKTEGGGRHKRIFIQYTNSWVLNTEYK